MRPLLAALILVALLGGLQLYMSVRPSRVVSEPSRLQPPAEGRFAVDVTLSFAAGPDPYALEPDDAPSLLVLFRGQEIIRENTDLEPGRIVRQEDVQSVTAGANEFFLRATPQDSNSLAARAVRLRVYRDGNPIAQQTLWSEPGGAVEGTVVVEVPSETTATSDPIDSAKKIEGR